MATFNEDPALRVVMRAEQAQWVPSPLPGVTRRMLARTGDEMARATSLVRYAPGSAFAPHTHGGGEEFLVLEGVFSDEHGDYPTGTYMRNPPGTAHRPSSQPGCLLFVKLWRFAADDLHPVCIDTQRPEAWQAATADRPQHCALHAHGRLQTVLERWSPNAAHVHAAADGGEEILVIEGELIDAHGRYGAGTWLRAPALCAQPRHAGLQGALIYRETGAATHATIALLNA